MHPKQTTGGPNLNISIAAPPLWTYAAGDTIIGSVNRHSYIVAPYAKISLTLIGRAGARLITEGYPSKASSYGNWKLFELPSQTLLRGHVHIPSPSTPADCIDIPFSINIPKQLHCQQFATTHNQRASSHWKQTASHSARYRGHFLPNGPGLRPA